MTEQKLTVHTERTMLDALALRYSKAKGYFDLPRYVVMERVRIEKRQADALVLDRFASSGIRLIFHEIKVSRADWLRELKQPEKSAEVLALCDEAWLVVPDANIVKSDELPEGWGLLALTKKGILRPVVKSNYTESAILSFYDTEAERRRAAIHETPWSRQVVASLLLAAAQTGARHAQTDNN